jgi:PAS domain S-box-containing protein
MSSTQPVAAVHPPAFPVADFGDFVANAPVGMHQVDPHGTILWVNEEELAMLGYRRDEYVGRSIKEFHQDRGVVEAIFAALAAGRGIRDQHSRMRRKDGTFVDVLISSNVEQAPGEESWRSRCVVRDISDLVASQGLQRKTEARLAERERQQATIARLGGLALSGLPLSELYDVAVREVASTLQVGHVGLCLLQANGRFSFDAGVGWPPGLVGTRDLPPDPGGQGEYMLRHRVPVVYPDTANETRFKVSRMVTDAGLRSGMTVLLPGPDMPFGILGAHALERREFTPDDVNFLAAVGQTLAAAIARSKVEAALDARLRQQATVARLGHAALHQGLRELMDAAAQEVAATLDAEFCKVLELDAAGRSLVLRAGVGWAPGSVGQATVPADHHSQAGFALRNDRAVIVDDLRTESRFEAAPLLVRHGVVSGMSVIIRGRQQTYGVLGVHSRQRRAFSADDINFLEAVAHLLGTAVERLHVQRELARSRDQLEATVAERTRQLASSNRELEAFSYSVSHDLRAPLRVITGYSTLLASHHGQSLTPAALDLLQGVQRSAERLGRLIDDLLDLSRVQRVDLVRDSVDLSAMAEQALANLAAAEPARKVAWTVEPGLRAEGDARLLGMLVDNLVGNAWKFTRHRADARIVVGRQVAGGAPALFVEDNGAGFDMAYAGKLFTPFQRLHRASEFEGTGIGLATVRRIVERHGGQVWAEGRPGEGATFYFTLEPGDDAPSAG